MSKAFYRKYRSKSLQEVVGQSHITDILSRALAEDKVAHAYLFTGPRGVGKTSIARILAHEINKLPYSDDSQHLDIIEIDAASNNGVEDIRDLRDKVQVAPVSAKKKVYIIDEVHMLSKAAFNALLKTLEEPPEHVVFILATTDADKLPATIISRTQRFNFRTIAEGEVVEHLAYIAKQEGFMADQEALNIIARRGEGSFRDSIGLLDQLSSLADKETGITKELVETFLGLPPAELVDEILKSFEVKDLAKIIELLDNSEKSGLQPAMLADEIIQVVRSRIAEQPELIPLLDRLIGVSSSPRPDIKLLIALSPPTDTKARSAALTSKSPEISIPMPKPTKSPPKEVTSKVVSTKSEKHTETPPPVSHSSPKPSQAQNHDFDWDKFNAEMKKISLALSTILDKCSYSLEGDRLIIYTGNVLYKKKLDDPRHRQNISICLDAIGSGPLEIETVSSRPPLKDEVAASVAAVMGGGEEFDLSESGGDI